MLLHRRFVDYYGSMTPAFNQGALYGLDLHAPPLQPSPADSLHLLAPASYLRSPASAVACRLAHARQLRVRSPISCMTYVPDGRRLLIGNEKGECHEWLQYKASIDG